MKFDWIRDVKAGDVLKAGSGRLRVVRKVHCYDKGGYGHYSVAFAINRCSWTKRCYTWLNDNDLRQRKFSTTSVTMPMRTKLDRLIADEIENESRSVLTCCDVVGIA